MSSPLTRVSVTLEGELADLIISLATLVKSEVQIKNVRSMAPCEDTEYYLCPLAALHDPDHPAKDGKPIRPLPADDFTVPPQLDHGSPSG